MDNAFTNLVCREVIWLYRTSLARLYGLQKMIYDLIESGKNGEGSLRRRLINPD